MKKVTQGQRFARKYMRNAPTVCQEEMAKDYDARHRRAKAEAWEKGSVAGFADAIDGKNRPNPYRGRTR